MSEEKITNQENTQENCPTGTCPMKKTSIGGQALMEGIMMRGPKVTAMAVRNPQGEIVLEKFPTSSGKRPWPWRVPVIRGIFNFVDTMLFGYKCLMRSAEISGLEEAEEELEREKQAKKKAKAEEKARRKAEKEGKPYPEAVEALNPEDAVTAPEAAQDGAPLGEAAETVPEDAAVTADAAPVPAPEATDNPAGAPPTVRKKEGTSGMMVLITVISVVLALTLMVGLFIILPTFLFETASEHISWIDGDNRYAKSVFTGIVKIILLVGYMSAISLMKDIRRTYMFHGAEHKTIFCYEAGLELTVENVRKMKRFHPRCGTSFLILMLLVSILVGFFIPPVLVPGNTILNTLVYSAIRLALVPLICGLGYELIKFCGRHDNWLTRIIAAPGLALQHLTVFEPDDSMIECAITAVKEVIPTDGSDKW